jgi:hypothetical protein
MSLAADSSRQEKQWQLQQENEALLAEVDQWRLALNSRAISRPC